MKKKTIKTVKDIIRKRYLTDWEFIVEEIAPEIEEEEFDVDEIVGLLLDEKFRREVENWSN